MLDSCPEETVLRRFEPEPTLSSPIPTPAPAPYAAFDLVAIVASLGGVEALPELLAALPEGQGAVQRLPSVPSGA